jgi:hypothetical protein
MGHKIFIRPNFEPTPEQIAETTKQIRSKWDKATKASRKVEQPPPPYELTPMSIPGRERRDYTSTNHFQDN